MAELTASIVGWIAGSVLAVSVVSLIGVWTLSLRHERLSRYLLYLVSFSAGGLLGDALLHLLPEAAEEAGGLTTRISLYVLSGLVVTFTLEKLIHWHHHNVAEEHEHYHVAPFAWTNLAGDFIHNIVDGMIIAGSFLVSIPVGIATTIAVVFHEIPQEFGDFAVLLHAGFSRARALLFNFFSALGAALGAAVALIAGAASEAFLAFLVPFAVGNFLYVAGSDLIPELHKANDTRRSLLQLAALLAGIGVMIALLALE